jgi:Phospholipase_D-nuclease N-terminal
VFIFDAEGVVAILLVLFWLWALFDCIATESSRCRNLPKPLWVILVLILPDIGSFLWLLLGRPERARWQPGAANYDTPRRPVGPEDEPRYRPTEVVTDRRSEELDRVLEQWEAEQRLKDAAALDARETALREREAELRKRELELRERETETPPVDES